MKASKIFTALSLFRRVRFPLAVFPMMITNLINFLVAAKRITVFLNQRECGGLRSVQVPASGEGGGPAAGAARLRVTGGHFQWRLAKTKSAAVTANKQKNQKENQVVVGGAEKKQEGDAVVATLDEAQAGEQDDGDDSDTAGDSAFRLSDVNLELGPGLHCVVGKVGAGKSSLLAAMLGEMDPAPGARAGAAAVTGTVSYVPQTPWILNKTVRENVLLGLPFDEAKYQTALRVSSLVTDMEILPAGDATEIGEKGINLSGGQKQRVALARAVYADRDIYVLDDPLSALDVHVGASVFQDLVCGHLKGKVVVLVTHDWRLLRAADSVVFVSKHAGGRSDGRATAAPSAAALAEKSPMFRSMLVMHVSDGAVDSSRSGGGGGSGDGSRSISSAGAATETTETDVDTSAATAAAVSASDVVPDTAGAAAEEKDAAPTPPLQATSASLAPAPAPKKATRSASKGKLTDKEIRQRGSVKCDTILMYFRSFFGCLPAWLCVTCMCLLYASPVTLTLLTNWWLAVWTASVEQGDSDEDDYPYYLSVYGALVFCALVMYFFSQLFLSTGAVNAATVLHDGLINAIMRAPMWWFETTPTGRTLSRCSKDVDEADTLLRESFGSLWGCLMESLGSLTLVVVLTGGWLALALLPIGVIYYNILQYYRHTSREIKRLESTTKSPIFSNFAETLNGLPSIRAMALEGQFKAKNLHLIDTNHRAYFLSNAANRWLSMRLEVVGAAMTLITACLLSGGSSPTDAALAGLALVYITQLLNELNWGVRQVSETEVRLNAVERLLEYQGTDFPLEKGAVDPDADAAAVPDNWPSKGRITFRDVSMRYRPNLPLALRSIDMEVPGGTRVGICGRTGSGKSSLFVSLFRIVELAGGTIEIDGVDLSTISLSILRRRVAVIPQNAQLFVGTVRRNLDPFAQFDDDAIWGVLRDCELHDTIKARPQGLSDPVAEGGANFSQGERQLICIARALLRKPKVLLLDEATASIDAATDKRIQEMVRRVFVGCTELTVAHRLNTIADSDLIAVLDDGRVAEFGAPSKLLENPASRYSIMVNKSDHDNDKR